MNTDKEPDKYLLSIITVTYNAQNSIEKTIQSVLHQTGFSGKLTCEYCFIDGGSDDDTLQIIEKYVPLLKEKGIDSWKISESDDGIYDAMNKGIRLARGRWIYLLNAGDCLYNNDILQKLEGAMQTSKADVLYSNYYRTNQYVSDMIIVPSVEEIKKTMIFCHQAVLIKRTLYMEQEYDISYRIVADYHLLLTMYLQGRIFEALPICMVMYNTEGISAKNMIRGYQEIYQVRKQAGVLNRKSVEDLQYVCGLVKRFVLGRMPQKLRWKIYVALQSVRRII